MQKFIILVLLCVIAYMMFSDDPGQTDSSSSLPKKEMSDAVREQVKLHFKGGSERATKDATWAAKDIFRVGVIGDGSNRDEYARYVCGVLHRHGFAGAGVTVQVIDVMRRGDAGSPAILGEARCDNPGRGS